MAFGSCEFHRKATFSEKNWQSIQKKLQKIGLITKNIFLSLQKLHQVI